jgi:hypothetical protein
MWVKWLVFSTFFIWGGGRGENVLKIKQSILGSSQRRLLRLGRGLHRQLRVQESDRSGLVIFGQCIFFYRDHGTCDYPSSAKLIEAR